MCMYSLTNEAAVSAALAIRGKSIERDKKDELGFS